jgi:DNA-directed RNA polymerase specialized sigma24 family protein
MGRAKKGSAMSLPQIGQTEQSTEESAWTSEDDLIIDFLSEGWTHQRTAETLGISTKTIQRRLTHRVFSDEVSRRRRYRIMRLGGQLVVASNRAIDVLADALESDDPKVNLRAASLVLDHGMRHRRAEDEQELARRQDELERQLAAAIDVVNSMTNSGQTL